MGDVQAERPLVEEVFLRVESAQAHSSYIRPQEIPKCITVQHESCIYV
jgi:hypothetical protein